MLKIVLVGYGELAANLMAGIIESGHKIVGVLSWEKSSESKFTSIIKDIFYPDTLTTYIKSHNIYQIKANSVNSDKFIKEVLRLNPDIILIGSWGEILKKNIIILPKIACINCHPSLLPKHRGANPYTSTIKEGESKSGITFHLVDEGIDTGSILFQKEVEILDNDTGGSLRQKCAFAARKAIPELLDGLENSIIFPVNQDELKASYFPRITDEDALISWDETAKVIHNRIRGMQPWTNCFTRHKNSFLIIRACEVFELTTPADVPGVILGKGRNSLIVATGDPYKAIIIKKIRLYGFLGSFLTGFYLNAFVKTGDLLEE